MRVRGGCVLVPMGVTCSGRHQLIVCMFVVHKHDYGHEHKSMHGGVVVEVKDSPFGIFNRVNHENGIDFHSATVLTFGGGLRKQHL